MFALKIKEMTNRNFRMVFTWDGERGWTLKCNYCFRFCFLLFFCKFYFIIFLYSRFLSVIHFIHISVYISIPIAQFIPPPSPPPPLSPLGVHTFVLYICVSISALQTGSSVPFSRFHIYVLKYDICFSLSDLLHSV